MIKKETSHSHLNDKVHQDVLNRLSRIEGQVRGLAKMVENDEYCEKIIVQFASVRQALNGAMMLLFDEHIRTCIANKMTENKQAGSDELLEIITRIVK
jgi:CsoR family transcriptional regulator, copper-sensing transcriptional repressor